MLLHFHNNIRESLLIVNCDSDRPPGADYRRATESMARTWLACRPSSTTGSRWWKFGRWLEPNLPIPVRRSV
eukprot:1188314-Prorocentrum_minimum.AAC.1